MFATVFPSGLASIVDSEADNPHQTQRRAVKAYQPFHLVCFIGNKAMAVEKVNSSSSLAEVVDRILDKGIVVDAWVRVSLVGIELLAIEARVVIASVETYLKYAEAVGLTAQAAVPAA